MSIPPRIVVAILNRTYWRTVNVPPPVDFVLSTQSHPLPASWNVTWAPTFEMSHRRIHSTPVTTSGRSGERNPWNPPRIIAHAFDDASTESSTRTSSLPALPT